MTRSHRAVHMVVPSSFSTCGCSRLSSLLSYSTTGPFHMLLCPQCSLATTPQCRCTWELCSNVTAPRSPISVQAAQGLRETSSGGERRAVRACGGILGRKPGKVGDVEDKRLQEDRAHLAPTTSGDTAGPCHVPQASLRRKKLGSGDTTHG